MYEIIIKLIPSYAKILSACVEDASMFELFIKEVCICAYMRLYLHLLTPWR